MVEPVEWPCDVPGCAESAQWAFTCPSCGKMFCSEHRLPERHACPFQPLRSMAAYLALNGHAGLLRGRQHGSRSMSKLPSKEKPAHVAVVSGILDVGWFALLILVTMNIYFVMNEMQVFPNAACPVLIDAGLTSGMVGLTWANKELCEGRIPAFELLPAQRVEAKMLKARFIAHIVVAVAAGIVACWGLGVNTADESADIAQSLGIVCLIGHMFALVGVMGYGDTLGKRKRDWYQQFVEWHARHEPST